MTAREGERPIRRLLVANRGEIAVRILRACHQLGIETVAIASDADVSSLHTQLADQVVEIGGEKAGESYLRIDRVLDAARSTGADAIHPGYGFLAENADFARAVQETGLIFIGPPAEVIEAMGVKTAARARMSAAGVPVVPGTSLPPQPTESDWSDAAQKVGYPLLVKAAAGGGGKGMRQVDEPGALIEAVAAARREAEAAFGDSSVYLERLLLHPRHVEVQILADSHGNAVHLGERDCSIQRRHQKIIEESPAPGLPADTREAMHAAAVRAAVAVGYVGAGTVEMLLDADGHFYFLEMNTRLQVEHPVTELITGRDLVAAQIAVAEGRPLPYSQAGIVVCGHAIEARLYAEDPASGFLPQTGELLLWEAPAGPGIRVDSGITSGTEVSLHYDPMLAKICAWGSSREQARRRLVEALREAVLLGPQTNLGYLIAILEHPSFAAGDVHTGFLGQHLGDWSPERSLDPGDADALLVAAATLLGGLVADARNGAHGTGSAQVAATDRIEPVWQEVGPLRLVGGGD